MKKLISVITTISMLFIICFPISAFAEASDVPSLKSISFNGATINEEFSGDQFDYTIALSNPSEAPTLKAYEIDGMANIFVNYSTNEANHQDGIIVKIEHENGAIYYNFKYSNAVSQNISTNNYLLDVSCNLGEVYPKINENDTDYRLYVPSDLTEITLSAATKDVSAIVEAPSTITLTNDQEPVIPITVTAANGDVREYTIKVKRLSKSSAQIKKDMQSPNFKSMVYGELFYQKPEFKVGLICAGCGVILISLAIFFAKRAIVKTSDEDEEEFFQ